MISEKELINRITPLIEERIQYRVIKNIINILEEEFYPPEDMIRTELIETVKNADKDKSIEFKNTSELSAYLDNLAC